MYELRASFTASQRNISQTMDGEGGRRREKEWATCVFIGTYGVSKNIMRLWNNEQCLFVESYYNNINK